MVTLTIGPADIAAAVKDVADVYTRIAADLRDRKVRRAVAECYDEMLRNPRFPYRRTATFAKVIGDRSPDLVATRSILTGLIIAGVRGSTGRNESWVKPDNWRLDDQGRVLRDENRRGVLKPGVQAGAL